MATPCKLIEVVEKKRKRNGTPFTERVDAATDKRPVPGDMFFAPWMLDFESPDSWAPRYVDAWDERPPLVVVLPNGQWWCLDQRAYKCKQGWHGDGWGVKGEPPHITASPSINTSSYHGTLADGVLSDDLGGYA